MKDINEAREYLQQAGVFYGDYDDDPKICQTLNQNDTWGWATAWGEYVKDEELPEVARLFSLYGDCGILYWVSEKNEQMKSEFYPMNRKVEFVRHEEKLVKEFGYWKSEWAYKKSVYTVGRETIKEIIWEYKWRLLFKWRAIKRFIT